MKTRTEKNKKIQKKIFKEEREKKAKKIIKITSIILIITLLILSYGMFIGAKVLIVKEQKITETTIPSSFHGIKIVQLSDILFNSLNEDDLKRLKEKTNELKPDILVFTGDLRRSDYELNKEDIALLENFFKDLKAAMGKFSVIGDNDDETFRVIMENAEFKILNNQSIKIYYKETNPIKIIGFDTNNLNYENIENEEIFSLCLLHNPDKIEEILNNTSCNVALAGDTLGGEIKIPFFKGIFDNHKYNQEYYKINNTKLYISTGLGNTINMRLFNHPSINLYRLTKY